MTAATTRAQLGLGDRLVRLAHSLWKGRTSTLPWHALESSSAMVKRYQHITAPVRMDIAKRVGGLLWAAPPAKPAGEDEDPDDGAAGVPISA